MQCIAGDRDGDLLVLIAYFTARPSSLERLQFRRGGWIGSAFSLGGGFFARGSDEGSDEANDGDDMSKKFHDFKYQTADGLGC